MIYPTRRAVLLAFAGAPVVLAVGALGPGLWLAGAAWTIMTLGLVLADAGLGADRRSVQGAVAAPDVVAVGKAGGATVTVVFGRGSAPGALELSLESNDKLAVDPARRTVAITAGAASLDVRLTPIRRGEGRLERLWMRWKGPLGLVWKQRAQDLDIAIPLVPDIFEVRQEAIRLFSRNASFGVKSQQERGEGSEFQSLRDFQSGMDPRTVDWSRSARHGLLVAKEFRTERNHHIVIALDTGRLMCQPLLGVPRIDRALNAALLLAFVSLKSGDRTGLFAFDSRPRLSTGVVSGTTSFPLLQKLASQIEYSAEETNFTLGLTQLSGELERRSLVVVFTDFADSTSAELMIENLGRLLSRHLVVFVVFRDEELEALTRAPPIEPDDVSRAVIAHTLLREREVVVGRLRRLGAQIVDAPAGAMGAALLDNYFDIKRRELL